MKRLGVFSRILFILFFIGFLCSLVFAQDETLTITTYYPSPYGVYRNLRLHPSSATNGCSSANDEGTLYYDLGGHTLNVCVYDDDADDDYEWRAIGGVQAGHWTQTDNNLYPNQIHWNVGIGTNAPSGALEVDGGTAEAGINGTDITLSAQDGGAGNTDGGDIVLDPGTGSGTGTSGGVGIGVTDPNAALQVNGAISRQGTALFGAGANTHVNLGNNGAAALSITGDSSGTNDRYYCTVGGGRANIASGERSTVAGGDTNVASGGHATVGGGVYCTASNTASTVIGGWTCAASGYAATVAGGTQNTASGDYSFAAGMHANAKDDGAFVWRCYAGGIAADYDSNGVDTFNVKADGGFYFTGSTTTLWGDVSEFMDVLKKENVQEAELVSLVGKDLLGRTKTAYDNNLIGVISSNRTMTLHLGPATSLEKRLERLPVALVGRCFVKVTNASGPIRIGDPITSSSQPGVGMKAARTAKIIGYAMQNEAFKDRARIKEILVFVNVGYYVSDEDYRKIAKIDELERDIELLKKRR